MDSNVQIFLILNAVAIVGVVLYMLRRRPSSGSRLRLGSASRSQPGHGRLRSDNVATAPRLTLEDPVKIDRERTLNVIFTYNGHDWDAYEVFGLPAGSSWDKVEKAYQEALVQVDEASQAFLSTAYKALRQKFEQKA